MDLKEAFSKAEIIFALILIIIIGCRKIDSVHLGNDLKKEATDSLSDCIHFVHPEWVDEITYDDTTNENYNSIVLKAYLKNDCNDTIALGMTGPRVTSSGIIWFCGEGFTDMIFDKSDTFQIVIPDDSIYVYIQDLKDEYVHKCDSVLVAVDYKVKDKLIKNMIKIDGHDFAFRERHLD